MRKSEPASAFQTDPRDNVAVAAQGVAPGEPVRVGDVVVTAAEAIPLGHKMALRPIPQGDLVVKYGVPIGRASRPIPMGGHAHTQNMEDITEQLCREYAAAFRRKAGEKS